MKRKTANIGWKPALFRTVDGHRWGSVWARWGISYARGRRYIVYLIGGPRLTEFDRLRCARRFYEAIDGLTDWSRPHADLIAKGRLARCYWAALRVIGGRPDLHLVQPELGATRLFARWKTRVGPQKRFRGVTFSVALQ